MKIQSQVRRMLAEICYYAARNVSLALRTRDISAAGRLHRRARNTMGLSGRTSGIKQAAAWNAEAVFDIYWI
jgi:hypothetical protein